MHSSKKSLGRRLNKVYISGPWESEFSMTPGYNFPHKISETVKSFGRKTKNPEKQKPEKTERQRLNWR